MNYLREEGGSVMNIVSGYDRIRYSCTRKVRSRWETGLGEEIKKHRGVKHTQKTTRYAPSKSMSRSEASNGGKGGK